MLRLAGGQVESLWDEVLPVEVRELPGDLAGLDRVVERCGVVGADRVGLAARSARSWSPDDLDGHVRAVDGDQAAHRLGVRDVGAGGVGLDASAQVLSDRVGGAGAGRVDGAQARLVGSGPEVVNEITRGGDREGQAGEAVSSAGGEDRLDRGGGRRALSDRFGAGVGQSARVLAREARKLLAGGGATRVMFGIARVRSAVGCGR